MASEVVNAVLQVTQENNDKEANYDYIDCKFTYLQKGSSPVSLVVFLINHWIYCELSFQLLSLLHLL